MANLLQSAALACGLLAMSACGADAPAPPQDDQATAPPAAAPPLTATRPWFICDGLDTASVFVLARSEDNSRVLVTEYAKRDGRPAWRGDYQLGPAEGAAGSIYTPLTRGGEAAGQIRQINPGMLDNPGSAYTAPYTSMQLGDREIACRWMARTRIIAFNERRSIVVHEDQDGDLIYSAYDFSAAPQQSPIELSDNSRTTAFTVEVRDGGETTGPGGQEFRFESGDILYLVTVPVAAPAMLEVWRGDAQIQSDMMIAQQVGQAE